MGIFVQQNSGSLIPIPPANTILTAMVSVSSAEILQLNTNPKIIIPAVIGKAIIPLNAYAILYHNIPDYQIFGNLYMQILTTTKALFYLPETDFLFAKTTMSCVFPFDSPTIDLEQIAGNNPLFLSCEFGDPVIGASDIVIIVNYVLI
jgi:hypothetical protein